MMKHKSTLSYFLFILMIFPLSRPCQAQVFSGKIGNLNNQELVILSLQDYVFWQRDTVYADQDGLFYIKLQLKAPGYIRLWGSNFRNETIYMVPGTDLHIEADGTDSDSFHDTKRFSGSAALYNNFQADLHRNEYLRSKYYDAKTYQLPLTEFLEYIDAFHAGRDSLKNDYFKRNRSSLDRPDQEVSDYMMIDSVHDAYLQVHAFRSYMQFLPKTQQQAFYETYIEPYFQNQQDDWRYLSSDNYRWFFATYIKRQFDLQNAQRKEKGLEAWPYHYYYGQATALMEKHLIRTLRRYVSSALLENISIAYPSVQDSLLPVFDQYTQALYRTMDLPEREHYYKEMFAGLLDFRNSIKNGQPAFDFEMQDSLGRTVDLADFKGKILYIDLWASWCGPCIAEFPAGHRLEKEFAGDDRLVFLSVSLDDMEKDWKKGMAQHHPPGQQFWFKDGMKSRMARDYGIKSIPHYILIDEKGNFISYKAPRPSDPKSRQVLEEALEKWKLDSKK